MRNRENPRGIFLGGSFCVKSNRGIQRLLGDVAVNVNEDCNNVLGIVVLVEYDVSILGALNAIILDCAVVISSLVIIAAYVDDLNIIVNCLGGQLRLVANLIELIPVGYDLTLLVVLVDSSHGARLVVVSILVLQVDSDIRCRVYLIRSLIEAYQIAFLQSGVAVALDQNGLLGVSININSVGGVGGVAILNSAVFLRYDTVNSVCGRTGRLGGQLNISCNNLVVVQNGSNSCTRLSLDIVQVADGVCVEVTRLTISIGLIYEYNSIRSSNLVVEGLSVLNIYGRCV